MESRSIEKLLPRSGGSIYRLVRMAANRALEISAGKPSLIQTSSLQKATSTALDEIFYGKIECAQVAKANGKKKGEAKMKNSDSFENVDSEGIV